MTTLESKVHVSLDQLNCTFLKSALCSIYLSFRIYQFVGTVGRSSDGTVFGDLFAYYVKGTCPTICLISLLSYILCVYLGRQTYM